MENIVWQDKKRPIFGLPLSFTKYTLNEEKLIIKTGFLSIKEDDVMLYRILDITLKQKLMQRLFKVGTIHCCSTDKTAKEFDILDVKNPKDVKEQLSKLVEEARQKKRVSSREYMSSSDDDDDDDEFHA